MDNSTTISPIVNPFAPHWPIPYLSKLYHVAAMAIRAAILTISDKAAASQRLDRSGPAIRELLESIGASVERAEVTPDEHGQIAAHLQEWADSDGLDVIITTGGTGLGPRDVTPEATADVIERPVPGLAELMRAKGVKQTPLAALSRGVAGVRGRCLIINLPGSERGVRQNLAAVIDLLPHAVDILRGRLGEHPPGGADAATTPRS
jgi:molybdenum cofactor synthesis domain-containing protein